MREVIWTCDNRVCRLKVTRTDNMELPEKWVRIRFQHLELTVCRSECAGQLILDQLCGKELRLIEIE